MSFPDQKKIESLLQVFGKLPHGITISEISSKTKMNRNLVAKYLDFLVRSGQLEMKSVGPAKQYSLSQRVPISALVDFSSDLIILLDTDMRIVRVNEQVLNHLGEKRDALVGKEIKEIENAFIRSFTKILLSGEKDNSSQEAAEFTSIVKGETNHYFLKRVPIVFEEGTPGTALVLHNITADMKYRQLREMTAAQHASLNEDQTEFVIRFLPDGCLKYMNNAFCHFFKRTPNECIGRTFQSFMPLEEQQMVEKALIQLSHNKPVAAISCRIADPTGKIRYQDWTLRAFFDEKGVIYEYQGVGRDITERHEATEKINQYIADQTFLYWRSSEFVDPPKDANIYEVIGRGVHEILPDAIVAVNSLELTSIPRLTTRCFLGERAREGFSKHLGKDIVGSVLVSPDTLETAHVLQNLLGGKIIKVPGNLYVMMMGQIPQDICEKIEKELNIGDMYILGFVSQNVILGNICLFLRKGEVLKHNELLEIYIRQATMGLRCRLAEEALNGKFPVAPPHDRLIADYGYKITNQPEY